MCTGRMPVHSPPICSWLRSRGPGEAGEAGGWEGRGARDGAGPSWACEGGGRSTAAVRVKRRGRLPKS
jgi:hypothetical protein